MSSLELSSMTVIELRKLAKEKHVRLGAGLSKEGIIHKLAAALTSQEPQEVPASVAEETSLQEEEAQDQAPGAVDTAPENNVPQEAPAQPPAREEHVPATQFKAAWHNPSPRYSAKPAYQAPTYAPRPAWQTRNNAPAAPRTPANAEVPRMNTTRPANYAPRFGPDAVDPAPAAPRAAEEYRSFREQPRNHSGFQDSRATYGERNWNEQRPNFQEGGFGPSAYSSTASSGYGPRTSYTPRRPDTGYYNQELGTSNPAVPEMLAAGECGDGQGILEIHPDGYGFLRPENFLPSSKDIYVSMAQIRRFGLRTGDMVVGKTRPQREGDKYAAMLYITQINGSIPDELGERPNFEDLTPVYPSRRIDLESHSGKGSDAMRITDLIAPIGFGQRGLLICPPDTGKTQFLQDFANVVAENYPQATVLVLLIDECPEDVTMFREQVTCEVVASTFDQAPENHLRLADMVLERAQRLVEQKQDVVLLVDSLTRLAKAYTTTAAQQGRNLPGMVNPSSLFRAKKLFGSARCVREGGSLTILGAMNVENGSKVDDTVVEEFKGTANMELVLDQEVAKAGVSPAINLKKSGTKRADLLMTPAELQGLQAIRSILASTHSASAIPHLLSMMDKASGNDELLAKIQEWVALMEKSR